MTEMACGWRMNNIDVIGFRGVRCAIKKNYNALLASWNIPSPPTMMFHHQRTWNVASFFIATYFCSIRTIVVAQNTGISLGNLTTRMHNVSGEVFVLSDRVLEVRGFVYDGQAPATYFWADTFSVPSINGYRLNDGSPTNGCGTTPLPQAANGTETYRVEFPDDNFIYKILGGSISLWCESANVSFGEVIVPSILTDIPETANGPALECLTNVVEVPVAAPTSIPAGLVPNTTTSAVPVASSPTTTTAPATSSPAAAPTPVVSTSAAAARHFLGHSVRSCYFVVISVTLYFLSKV